MTDIWIMLIEDRHADVEARPFSNEAEAIAIACQNVPYGTGPGTLSDVQREDGWVLWLPYGTKGARVRVVKRTIDEGLTP